MTKKIFNPGEFYLLVPDSKINYETTKEQYLDSVLIHHTFSIKNDLKIAIINKLL